MYVVVKENHYGHESGYTVSDIIGPFSSIAAAESYAADQNAKDEYAIEYYPQRVTAA